MTFKSITLSDNQLCKVRQLGLFELDNVGREILGPYEYTMLSASGQLITDQYDLRALDEIPKPPDRPLKEIEQGTDAHFQLLEYDTYLAALAHEKVRAESYHGYCQDVTTYILTNCLDEADRQRIVTIEDWETVYQAALVPELTMEVLAQVLGDVFQGFFFWAADLRRPFNYSGRDRQSGWLAVVGN